jgi:hypothetical protein
VSEQLGPEQAIGTSIGTNLEQVIAILEQVGTNSKKRVPIDNFRLEQLVVKFWNKFGTNLEQLEQMLEQLEQVRWNKLGLGMGYRGVPRKFRDTSTTCSNGWKHELHAEQLVPMGN